MTTFTREELDTLSDDALHRLAKYVRINVNARTSRKKLIERLVGAFAYSPSAEPDNPEPSVSVRVARIREQFLIKH